MISKSFSRLSMLAVCVSLFGCATPGGTDSTPANDNMDAVLWLQNSTEYAAATTGVYRSATATLREIANAEGDGTRSMAIVMDIDETVLDNSPYQGQLIFDDATYNGDSWDAWVALRAAVEVPGAVEFIRTSQSLGFHVVFITNRPCRLRSGTSEVCPQAADTLANLEDVGVDTSSTTLYLMGERPSDRCAAFLTEEEQDEGGVWSSDKTSRRECVSLDYEIVMLFGDQLGDFTELDAPSEASGRDVAAEYAEHWGSSWFVLPNPTYGGWKPRDPAEKPSRLRGID